MVAESRTQSWKVSNRENVKDESASHGFVAREFCREVGGVAGFAGQVEGTTDRDCGFLSDGQKAPARTCQLSDSPVGVGESDLGGAQVL